jgi:hypothetical protein
VCDGSHPGPTSNGGGPRHGSVIPFRIAVGKIGEWTTETASGLVSPIDDQTSTDVASTTRRDSSRGSASAKSRSELR